jgi:hypothetical protein
MSRDYIAFLKTEKAKYFPQDGTDKTDKTLLSVLSVPIPQEKNTFGGFVSPSGEEKKSLFQMTASEESSVRGWLSSINENDPATIDEVLGNCRSNSEARDYFLGRAAEPVIES